MTTTQRIGIISDTHGLLRPEAAALLRGVDLIIHAGDVGKPEILDALRKFAPLVAVRGNVDTDDWAQALPETAVVPGGERLLYVLHNRSDLEVDPAGFHVIISGHTHQPKVEWQNGVLYLNPGSAGPRRFSLPVTLAFLTINGRDLDADIVSIVGDRSR